MAKKRVKSSGLSGASRGSTVYTRNVSKFHPENLYVFVVKFKNQVLVKIKKRRAYELPHIGRCGGVRVLEDT